MTGSSCGRESGKDLSAIVQRDHDQHTRCLAAQKGLSNAIYQACEITNIWDSMLDRLRQCESAGPRARRLVTPAHAAFSSGPLSERLPDNCKTAL